MCKCTPEIRTPFCGKQGCELPKEWQMGRIEFRNNQTGWECPRCQAVMSPTFPTCVNCKPKIGEKTNNPSCSTLNNHLWKYDKYGRNIGCIYCGVIPLNNTEEK